MSTPSKINSFKQLEEYLDNPFDTQSIHENLSDFWKKVDDIQDDLNLDDGDHMPSE